MNLTAKPCQRRIQRLERDGFIRRKVAILDKKHLGLGITVLVAVRTNQHSDEWLNQFHLLVSGMPEVIDSVRLAGGIDCLIRVVVPDVPSDDAFYKRLISKLECYDVSSMFQMEKIKSTTALPLTAYTRGRLTQEAVLAFTPAVPHPRMRIVRYEPTERRPDATQASVRQ